MTSNFSLSSTVAVACQSAGDGEWCLILLHVYVVKEEAIRDIECTHMCPEHMYSTTQKSTVLTPYVKRTATVQVSTVTLQSLKITTHFYSYHCANNSSKQKIYMHDQNSI